VSASKSSPDRDEKRRASSAPVIRELAVFLQDLSAQCEKAAKISQAAAAELERAENAFEAAQADVSRETWDPAAVPGSLLLEFDRHWPPGWIQPYDVFLWGSNIDEEPLDAARVYDLAGWNLESEDEAKTGYPPGELRPLVSFVREFWERQREP